MSQLKPAVSSSSNSTPKPDAVNPSGVINEKSLTPESSALYKQLIKAIEKGEVKAVERLLIKGAPLQVENNVGKTPLTYAAFLGQHDVVKHLLATPERQAMATQAAKYGYSAFLEAVRGGRLPTAQWLLTAGHSSIAEKDKSGNTALLAAVQTRGYGSTELPMVQWLLTQGVSIAETDRDGQSAILLATKNRHYDVALCLATAHGAAITEMEIANLFNSLLGYGSKSFYYQDERLFEFLVAAQIRLSGPKGLSAPLFKAIERGNTTAVKELVKQGAPLNDETINHGHTPLTYAASLGDIEVVRSLLAPSKSHIMASQVTQSGTTALLAAAKHGSLFNVRWLRDHGASITERDKEGRSAMDFAMQYSGYNRGELVALLKTYQDRSTQASSSSSSSESSSSPSASLQPKLEVKRQSTISQSELPAASKLLSEKLFKAIEKYDATAIKILLRQGAPLHVENSQGDTPLTFAAAQGISSSLEALLDVPESYAMMMQTAADGTTALAAAAQKGQLDMVKWLVLHGASISEKYDHGETLLLKAACWGELEVVQWLLDQGASITERDDFGRSALDLATKHGFNWRKKTQLIEFLTTYQEKSSQSPSTVAAVAPSAKNTSQKAKPDVKSQGGLISQNSLSAADKALSKEMFLKLAKDDPNVDRLIEKDQLLNVENSQGDTLLTLAVKKLNWRSNRFKCLLATPERRLQVAQPLRNGQTALLIAVEKDSIGLVECLLEHGVSISEKNKEGDTALMVAARHFDFGDLWGSRIPHGMVRRLLFLGASPMEKNAAGDTALLIAARTGSLDAVICLSEAGASITDQNNKGETALCLAASNGHSDLVKWLLAKLATISKENEGRSAIELASQYSGSDASKQAQVIAYINAQRTSSAKPSAAASSQPAASPAIPASAPQPVQEAKRRPPKPEEVAAVTRLTAEIRGGDATTLQKILTTPAESRMEAVQDYVQSQAVWTVFESKASPLQKNQQIALLAQAPEVSLLVENNKGQLPVDVALEQGMAEETVVLLQNATEEQLAQQNEAILQVVEAYAQALTTEAREAKVADRKKPAADNIQAITPQQLAEFIQQHRRSTQALQERLSQPLPPSSASSSAQTGAMSAEEQRRQMELFCGLVQQMVSEKFIVSAAVGRGWVEEVVSKSSTAAKTAATALGGFALNIILPIFGSVIVGAAGFALNKAHRNHRLNLNRKYALGITSLDQLAMITKYIEQGLLHRYQDFLLQQYASFSPAAMKTFVQTLVNRIFTYVEAMNCSEGVLDKLGRLTKQGQPIDEVQVIRALLGEKLVNLSKQVEKPTKRIAFTPEVAKRIAENLVAGTSWLSSSLLPNSSIDALICCTAANGRVSHLHIKDICQKSPMVTWAEEGGNFVGCHVQGSTWTAGNHGVMYISREEAQLRGLVAATPWTGDLPWLRGSVTELDRIRAEMADLRRQLVAEKSRADRAEARLAEQMSQGASVLSADSSSAAPLAPVRRSSGAGLFDKPPVLSPSSQPVDNSGLRLGHPAAE